MKKNWNEQQAIITGGASGIGLAIAKKLHNLGVKVVLCDLILPSLDAAQKSVGQNARILRVDVTDLKAVEAAIGGFIKESAPFDILVNSAGVTGKTNIKSHETDPADVDFVFRVNFFGSYYTSRAVLPAMIQQKYGRITQLRMTRVSRRIKSVWLIPRF